MMARLMTQQRGQGAQLGDQEIAEAGDAVVVDAAGRSGDRDGGDDRAVDGPDRGADRTEPQLQLVQRRGPAPASHLDEEVVELGAVHRRVRGAPLRVPGRHRQRAERVEHLAQRRAVRGDVHADPVRRTDQVAAVHLVDLHELAATRDGEVHGLARQLRQVLHGGPGEFAEVVQRAGPGGVQGEQRARPEGSGPVPMDEPAALQRLQEPRGRGLREAELVHERAEGARRPGLDDQAEQGAGAFDGLAARLRRHKIRLKVLYCGTAVPTIAVTVTPVAQSVKSRHS